MKTKQPPTTPTPPSPSQEKLVSSKVVSTPPSLEDEEFDSDIHLGMSAQEAHDEQMRLHRQQERLKRERGKA